MNRPERRSAEAVTGCQARSGEVWIELAAMMGSGGITEI